MMPYMTIKGDTEVLHSNMDKRGFMIVHFEKPDSKNCFNEMDIELPSMAVIKNVGFNEDEVKEFLLFCERNARSMVIYSALGGVVNA
ncbi:MAG: hypothetical protein LBS29_04310 [Endomicrobium sp.]|jgi:hypothetical protein|nr:hypothetical protein [Endomicrobium sp.]